MKNGPARGLRFNEDQASLAIEFVSLLRHSKGEWAGRPFIPSLWQKFWLWVLFGWQRRVAAEEKIDAAGHDEWVRRFRIAYNEIPRKNGKSTLAAAVALKLLVADGEAGAEVYSAATKKDQARIVFSEAVRMVRKSPALRRRCAVNKSVMTCDAMDGKFEPLSADEDTLDGLNPNGAIIDELHKHKNRGVWDVLETATGSRRQPLLVAITTAGDDEESICFEIHDYAERILDGFDQPDGFKDDTLFAFIATIDEGDDWTDPKSWAKANPGFGVNVKPSDLAAKVQKAIRMPGARAAVQRMHLNVWRKSTNLWLPMDHWKLCGEEFTEASLAHRSCAGGLDLAATQDLAAWALMFPPNADDPKWRLLVRLFMPIDRAKEKQETDHVPYLQWIADGWINGTDGDEIDYATIEAAVLADRHAFAISDVGYDQWNAAMFTQRIEAAGMQRVKFAQSIGSYNEPSKTFESLILHHRLAHQKNPCLTWMASCAAIYEDANGNIRPVKPKRGTNRRIDGIVAALMALGRAKLVPTPMPRMTRI